MMEKCPPSEYEAAFAEFFHRVIIHEIDLDPRLKNFRRRVTKHSGSIGYFFRNHWIDKPVRSQVDSDISSKSIQNSNFDDYILMLRALGEKARFKRYAQFENFLINGMIISGQTLEGNPQLSWDNILAALERVDMSFDEDGGPKIRLHAGEAARASLAQSAKPVDFEERFEAIIEKKRMEFNAKARTRRLFI